MRVPARKQARWHRHVNAINPPAEMRHWLTDCVSLTAKLMAHSGRFLVQPLRQRRALGLSDEHAAVNLPRRVRVWERDVLLQCDGQAVVYAHTIVPSSDSATEWPFFRSLGSRSLGSALFSDPLIKRGRLQFSRLPLRHPLMKRAASVLGQDKMERHGYARRCLYSRKKGHLLVTELFLPSITTLSSSDEAKPARSRRPTQGRKCMRRR